MRRPLIAVLVVLALAACANPRKELSDRLSHSGFDGRWYAHDGLSMLIAVRQGRGGTPIMVIEGDGLSYSASGLPNDDPTPVAMTAVRMATALARAYPDSEIIYAARPCQFMPPERLQGCPQRLWTSERFSAPVRALYAALAGNQKPVVVGYSGGGVIAAHLAADGVASGLVTVVAPLALNQWAATNGLSGFALADDPLFKRDRVAVPQRHIAGGRDHIVDPAIIDRFAKDDVWLVDFADHEFDFSKPVLMAMRDMKIIRPAP